MSFSHRVLKTSRQIHLYLGVFIAPMLLFFAITGGLQTFSLHETSRGSDYKPPAWLAGAAQLHKKQTTLMPTRRPRPAEPARVAEGGANPIRVAVADARPQPTRNLLPMKLFFALVSLGLLISTLTGLYMAYRYSRKPLLVSAILMAGIAVPLLLLLF